MALMLEVVDGSGLEPVRLVKEPFGKSCAVHCARHGSGPFACCKCGAEFERA